MRRPILALAAPMLLACPALAQGPVSSIFTYQGELHQSGAPITTAVDLRFRLYDAPSLGAQVGPQLATTLTPASGRFTADLDFGAVFAGQNRWLEIDIRPAGGPAFTTLTPRQPLYAAPNASFALTAAAAGSAASAANASQLNGQSASFYLNASNLTGGTLPAGLLGGSYTGFLSFTNPTNTFTGVGSGLTALNASNLSTGSLPDARLSSNVPRLDASNTFSGATNAFSGMVHSTTSGYRFPDNTIQTTSALDPGDLGFVSGYPAGTTLTVTINNTAFPTARMVGSWRINRPTTGGPQWSSPPTLRRPRTADHTWFNWVQSGTTLSGLRLTVAAPGGSIDYDLPTGRVSSYRLITGDDGLPFEEVSYITGNSSLPGNISTLFGSPIGVAEPTVVPRLGQATGSPPSTTYRPVWNNIRSDAVRIVGNPVFTVPIDPASGLQTGQIGSATVTVRANSLAAALNLDGAPASRPFRLVLHPSAGNDIDLTNNVTGTIISTTIRLADDGLPVEEYDITFPFNPPP
ncbi:MAG: hypothetical protein WD749_05805 [Phycisphaerales bacterium]